MAGMQGVLPGDIHVADECVHRLHGSLCHLWVRHRPQDVHKEQLGGSGKHPARAQAEMTRCHDVYIARTLLLTSQVVLQLLASVQACVHNGVTC